MVKVRATTRFTYDRRYTPGDEFDVPARVADGMEDAKLAERVHPKKKKETKEKASHEAQATGPSETKEG